jgi:L-fuculose-phosphate aldolase
MKMEEKLKEEICDIGRRMYTNGFVAANDGNISVKLGENEYLTTPTGISKGFLTPDMITKVDSAGEVLEGTYAPSTEIKVHVKVYKERPDVSSVIHAHPPYATAYAIAGISLDKCILPETVYALGSVPVVQYAIPGSQELADGLITYLQSYDALLLENHGTLTVGPDLINAYYMLERVEFYAKMTFLTKLIGNQKELPKNEIEKLIAKRKAANLPGKHPGL